MTIRGAIPNTAKRLAENFGVSTSLTFSIPNTAAKLAAALGGSFVGETLPNNEERIAQEFGISISGGIWILQLGAWNDSGAWQDSEMWED